MIDFLSSSAFTWILNAIFFMLIFIAYLFAISALRKSNKPNYLNYAPTLMTSIGLFGTFFGIFIGLLHFNPSAIDESIQQLLGGLQTAFVTSIIGMAFAIVFKVQQTKHLDQQNLAVKEIQQAEVEPKDIHQVLLKQHALLGLIAKGVGGNDERSLVGQLQMLRTDVVDFRSGVGKHQENFEAQLWIKMDEFAEMLSKSATEQVIEALKQVIVEFNHNLTEQFGENFKRLDESVKKLVDWQDNYAKQLEEMTQLYRLGVSSIDSTKTAVEGIRVEAGRIPEDMKILSNVLSVNQHQIGELSRHLESFVEMRNQAVVAMPQIQAKLEEVGQQLREGAEKVNMILIQGSKQFEDSVKHTNESLLKTGGEISTKAESISEEMKNSMELLGLNTERIRTGVTGMISESMSKMEQYNGEILSKQDATTQELKAGISSVMQKFVSDSQAIRQVTQQVIDSNNSAISQHADRSMSVVEKQVQEAVNRTNDAVNSQLKQLDEALSRQLNAALKELGSSLASIAEHLMKTYKNGSEGSRQRF